MIPVFKYVTQLQVTSRSMNLLANYNARLVNTLDITILVEKNASIVMKRAA